MQRDRSVGRLLTRAFAALVLLIVGAGVIETVTVVIQHRVVDQLSHRVQPLQLHNAHVRGLLADGQRGVRGYLLTGDGAQLDTYHVARADYPAAVASLRSLARGDDRAAVDAQVRLADAWWAHAELQRQAPPRSDAATAFVGAGWPMFQEFLAANESFDATLRDRAGRLQQRSATLGWFTTVTLVVVTGAAAVLAAVTAARVTRRITRPLGHLVAVIDRLRTGDSSARADPDEGPAEIRAVAAAVNTQADEGDRVRSAEQRTARLRGEVRKLGYRIRAHLAVDDAIREAIDGLAATLDADHVLIRMRPEEAGVPAVASLRDEHAGGRLAALAGCDIEWLHGHEVWYTASPDAEGRPPDTEVVACCPTGGEHALTVAVHAGSDLLGALTLIRDDGPAWTPVEARLAESVAADLGRGVHYARLYEQEQSLVARLKELDTVKTDFMSTVSHELRTPLTSISGYLELLLDAEAGELTDPQRRMLEVIGRNTRRLRELIEDLLILSRIESGNFRTAKQDVEIGGLVDGALAAIAPAAAKASVGLHTDVERPLALSADPEQLDRVLTNLLANAVKFTPPEGTVMVMARRDGDEIVLSVADTGMGIPEAEQAGLFGRFFRASNAIQQAIPGTGLGLAIVATIVQNHGGSITVRSTENVGTTFTVRLPAS